jgi:hypothetical protein
MQHTLPTTFPASLGPDPQLPAVRKRMRGGENIFRRSHHYSPDHRAAGAVRKLSVDPAVISGRGNAVSPNAPPQKNIMNGYFILYVLAAIWLFRDAKKRLTNGTPWAACTVLFGLIVVPVWLAKRPLKEGEVREGGTAWNVLKNFALMWTATVFIVFIAGMASAAKIAETAKNDYEKAGAGIGMALGGFAIFMLWFVVVVSAVVFGFFLKKSSIIEKGPTGPLARA